MLLLTLLRWRGITYNLPYSFGGSAAFVVGTQRVESPWLQDRRERGVYRQIGI